MEKVLLPYQSSTVVLLPVPIDVSSVHCNLMESGTVEGKH